MTMRSGYLYTPTFETCAFPVDPPGAEAPAWDPDLAGFAADVLSNPNGRQVREVVQARAAILEIATEEAEAEYLQVIAPWVTRWNLEARDEDGVIRAVPAPGDAADNWRAFYLLPVGLLWWITRLVPAMHLPRVKAIWLGETSTQPSTPDALPVTDEPKAA